MLYRRLWRLPYKRISRVPLTSGDTTSAKRPASRAARVPTRLFDLPFCGPPRARRRPRRTSPEHGNNSSTGIFDSIGGNAPTRIYLRGSNATSRRSRTELAHRSRSGRLVAGVLSGEPQKVIAVDLGVACSTTSKWFARGLQKLASIEHESRFRYRDRGAEMGSTGRAPAIEMRSALFVHEIALLLLVAHAEARDCATGRRSPLRSAGS